MKFTISTLALIIELLVFLSSPAVNRSYGAEYKTKNFTVITANPNFAKAVGDAAEVYRVEMAELWLGRPLAGNWSSPCPIRINSVGPNVGAGGATSFAFNEGQVFGWTMTIQGSEQRILDSVLPHEISHMVFASYFRRPLPRWADEGAATTIEHESERVRQIRLLNQVILTSKHLPLEQLLKIKEYPRDMQDVLTLYAEGYSLSKFLIDTRDPQTFLIFLQDAYEDGWEKAFLQVYGFTSLKEVEQTWKEWINNGSQEFTVNYQCNGRSCPPPNCGNQVPRGGRFVYPFQRPRGGIIVSPPRPTQVPPPVYQPPMPAPPPVYQPPRDRTPPPTPNLDPQLNPIREQVQKLEEQINSLREQLENLPTPEDGEDGEDGDPGVGIETISISDEGNLVVSLSDGSLINVRDGCCDTEGDWDEARVVQLEQTILALQQFIDNYEPPETPKPEDPKYHFVLTVDPVSQYWPNLELKYKDASDDFSMTLLEKSSGEIEGQLPALVLYESGTPQKIWRGLSTVNQALLDIGQGKAETLIGSL